ncbi:MAG: T9SS type A sorting domain-containing protein [Bacteroidota bacterium]|nr:T9SS type A sorting domain-containing protein [Bacteroidota bacterium]
MKKTTQLSARVQKKLLGLGLFVTLAINPVLATSKTPLMGWASWNNYSVNISESIIEGQADAMVSSGLAAAGYKYINIDDGFFYNRDASGNMLIDPIKFPNGMKVVADYIHSKGLKAGFYSDAGSNTCGSIYNGQTGGTGVGMYNHDQQDADLFFKTWGFDFLKVDYCGGLQLKLDEKTRYSAIKTAIDNTGRTDINFNVCRWQFPGVWVTSVADSWRISQDINASWSSVTSIIDKNAYLAAYASQGHYNDMDMLEVGRGLTTEEDKSHFSMWCIMSSPLVLGNDMTNISTATKNILTNSEVIAVNQDTTGLQAHIVTDNSAGLQVWAKNLNGKFSKERAVALFNRTSAAASMSVKWKDLNLVGAATVRDLWAHSDLGTLDSMYTVTVPSHGVVMIKVVGTQTKLQEVFEAEYGWINNFNLTQNSVVVSSQGVASASSTCSGGAKAGWLGNRADNYIEFRDIYAQKEGNYTLTLSYISGENRNATFTINGKDTLVTNLNSGGWSTLKNVSFPVNLKNGYNTIRISNSTGWLPDIDKIQLNLNQYEIAAGLSVLKKQSVRIHPNPCKATVQIETDSPLKSVEFFSMSGALVKKSNLATIYVSGLKPGNYIVKVTTDNEQSTQQLVKL